MPALLDWNRAGNLWNRHPSHLKGACLFLWNSVPWLGEGEMIMCPSAYTAVIKQRQHSVSLIACETLSVANILQSGTEIEFRSTNSHLNGMPRLLVDSPVVRNTGGLCCTNLWSEASVCSAKGWHLVYMQAVQHLDLLSEPWKPSAETNLKNI